MKILVTGAAGFIGSNLCEVLVSMGNEVWAVDNLYTGDIKNLSDVMRIPEFKGLIKADIAKDDLSYLKGIKFDQVYNLACPASPPAYQMRPVDTILTCTQGVHNILEIAKKCGATFLQTSTSEVYGDPDISPQREDYRGNVNCWGPRACYDEGKRCAEALCYEYSKYMPVRVARIFNTYGPKMSPLDGRVLTNMITQALKGEDITVYGDGSQTRSFCYVDDTVDGLIKLMNSGALKPINIGNPEEHTILEMAEMIKKLTNSKSKIVFKELPQDDPKQRRPDVGVAEFYLGWKPETSLQNGLNMLISYLKEEIK